MERRKAEWILYRFFRNVFGKRKALKQIRCDIDSSLQKTKRVPQGLAFFQTARRLMFVYQTPVDDDRFFQLCCALLKSMEQPSLKGCYVSVSLDKRYSVLWICQMKKILELCCQQLLTLIKAKAHISRERLDIYLNMLSVFTVYTLWKFSSQLGDAVKSALHLLCVKFVEHIVKCNFFEIMLQLLDNLLPSTATLAGYSLVAMMGFRQLAICNFPSAMMMEFATTVFSVPGCIYHLEQKAPESLSKLRKVEFTSHLLRAIKIGEEKLSLLKVNTTLSILGNLTHLCSLQIQEIEASGEVALMLDVLKQLITQSESHRLVKGASMSCWHPFFGWIKTGIDRRNISALELVRKQFQHLWSRSMVHVVLKGAVQLDRVKAKEKLKFSILKKSGSVSIKESTLREISDGCTMYVSCSQVFPLLSMDMLLALSCNGDVIGKLWLLLSHSMSFKVHDAFQLLTCTSSSQSPLYSVLVLAIQVTQYFIATLDDEELHIQQQYFPVDDLRDISLFLNELVCKMIVDDRMIPVFVHCHSLLTLLYRRDCKRSFTGDPNFWILKKIKVDLVMKDLKLRKKYATDLLKYTPHCIPRKQRVKIFSDWIKEDKDSLGLLDRSRRQPATYITIQRSHILEGGYEQLSSLPVRALKGVVRVKFVNEQGLDEAGIDETGVFKEFLEEVISKAFDPCLNLFKVSSQELLYPSPSSSIQDNYLSLFEFIGKMLGKAVYEGIAVDIQFAAFFLSQMLEHHMSSLYSSLDDLVSLDPDLYRSLCYVKHAESGFEDLSLTFIWDEDCLGKVVTHELIPGGSHIDVTAANRISYVHRMSYFMLYTRLMKQSKAFVQGFYSVINRSWIELFSPHELQSLISGDHVGINIEELKKSTQYVGGYHANHKIITWMWDIVTNDFDDKERGAFIKFVTSCSRPPLLGFANLNPPFTIRCVNLTEDEDRMSIGTVLRGFFSLQQQSSSSRLPTASTCFNLLKLPNYSRKSVLKEKLRYAISSNSGFELS